MGEGKLRRWKAPAKYFMHGLAFSALFLATYEVWTVVVFPLLVSPFLTPYPWLGRALVAGFFVGMGLLSIIIGYLNSLVTSFLWFSVKKSLLNSLGHGLALLIMLLTAQSIFVLIPNLVAPSLYTQIITFIVGTFINGLVGKFVAKGWRQEER